MAYCFKFAQVVFPICVWSESIWSSPRKFFSSGGIVLLSESVYQLSNLLISLSVLSSDWNECFNYWFAESMFLFEGFAILSRFWFCGCFLYNPELNICPPAIDVIVGDIPWLTNELDSTDEEAESSFNLVWGCSSVWFLTFLSVFYVPLI